MIGNVFKVCVLSICFLLPICSTIGTASSAQRAPNTAYDYYLSGNALYRAGRHGEAVSAFRKSVELDPKYYYARANLGVALAKTGQFDKAAQQFTFCVSKKWGGESDRFVFHYNRALALKADGQSQSALNDWTTLKQIDPVRAEQLEDSGDYILMDVTYMAKRNRADMSALFKRNRSKIANGEIIIRRIANQGNAQQEHEVIGLIDGTLEQVSGVLSDFKNYPKFMPNVEKITIRDSRDGGKVVDHTLGLPMGFVKKYRLKFESKNEVGRWQLFWKKLPWPGVKDSQTVVDTYGQWILENLTGSDDKVLAYYRVYTDTGKIPFGTAWIVEPMTKKSFQDMFKGTRRRVKDLYN
ncbi:MAG: tetratricopeptide repeat protein [Phycisphaerales bacterium]|nr:MAG: tetratricopeptide repeat protein [Phycisphaerales bacterium]